jgi:hypothetical protein
VLIIQFSRTPYYARDALLPAGDFVPMFFEALVRKGEGVMHKEIDDIHNHGGQDSRYKFSRHAENN